MLTIGELALFLESRVVNARHGLVEITQHLMEHAAVEAKAVIGHELDQWPPLAASTIAEKQRLGYVNQISPTDPLLRTGDMRESVDAAAEATSYGAKGVIGSRLKEALWQELGTAKIPSRPFLAGPIARIETKARHEIELYAMALLRPPIV